MVPNLIFVVPESILNISLPIGMIGVCLSYTVVLLWKMPEHFHACSISMFQPETDGERKPFLPPSHLSAISLYSVKSLQSPALNTRKERHRRQHKVIIFPPGLEQALKSLEVVKHESLSSLRASQITYHVIWNWV